MLQKDTNKNTLLPVKASLTNENSQPATETQKPISQLQQLRDILKS